jgi:succinylglutamate desuccinylase/aspartoacylase family protein
MTALLFDPATCARNLEAAARAGDWDLHWLNPTPTCPRPWFSRYAKVGRDRPGLYISAGIHGDEIAGPLTVLEMLRRPGFFDRFHTVIFPLLNPEGLARNTRGNAEGIDLNRDYREPKAQETMGHIAALKTLGRFDAAMMLHEDFEGIGAYLYELNEGVPCALGADMIAAMGRHVPIDMRPEIEGVTATGGVINRRDVVAKHGAIEDRPDWPEAIYLSLNHTRVSITTESPMPFPLEQRIAAQIAAVQTLMEALDKKLN